MSKVSARSPDVSPRPHAKRQATDEAPPPLGEHFRRHFDLGPIGMAITSPTKGIVEVNDDLCETLGYSRSELLQMTWAQLTHPDDVSADIANRDRVVAGDVDGYSMETRFVHKDGRAIDCAISVKCARRADGAIEYFVALTQDVGQRKRVEMVLDSMTDSFFAFDADWRYTYINSHGEEQFKRLHKDPARMIGKVLWDEFPVVPSESALRRAMSERVVTGNELYLAPLGEWVEDRIFPSADGGLVVFQKNITERKRAAEERDDLLRRVITAQEAERRRISREIHDQIGEELSTLMLKLAALKNACRGQEELLEQVKSAELIAVQLDDDLDSLVWSVRPTALDDLGLLPALSNVVNSWSRQFAIGAKLHTRGMEKYRLADEIETALYRAVQEALTNITKHAKARRVDILLERREGHVSLIVEDDGVGFEAEHAFTAGAKGLGLIGMHERAVLAGGTMVIESNPGHGTTVFIRIPAIAEAKGTSR
jgi:PAS domain S-box-containing protein